MLKIRLKTPQSYLLCREKQERYKKVEIEKMEKNWMKKHVVALFSKNCPLVVDFLRASGGFNSKTVLVESEES